ncbi:Glucan 1,3-beta-glucosidase 3 [Dipsacomyces acuminosporus]|nr:Glucan 1,3-beta-glucosidase 3 [Dipsacomyces acuminosporus]
MSKPAQEHLCGPVASPPPIEELRQRMGAFAPFDQATAQVLRFRKMYGVNLGSFFCLEPWMATEIYRPFADEANRRSTKCPESEGDLVDAMGGKAKELMEQHWRDWIQRADFARMASIGINTVRLPVGWWVLGRGYTQGLYDKHADVYTNCLFYIARAVRWAAEFDVGVLIDIHAVPGGQNKDSHSGITGAPLFYSNPACQDLAIECYKAFTELFADITNIVGLQIINEPIDDPGLWDFYTRALKEIRSRSASLPVYIGDAWNPDRYVEFAKQSRDRLGFIVLDMHKYWVFRPEGQQHKVPELTRELWEDERPRLEKLWWEANGNIVVGEYSAVLASRSYEGEDPAKCMGAFVRQQMEVFDRVSAGTFYWTWRLQHDSWFWSFQYSLDQGIVPRSYFPFAWSPDRHADKRAEVIRMVEEHRSEWREKRLQGHKHYVSKWDGEFGFGHYAAGFDMGLDSAIRFYTRFSAPSKVGFVKQLSVECSVRYAKDNGGDQWRWEYEDAFREAQEEYAKDNGGDQWRWEYEDAFREAQEEFADFVTDQNKK